MKNKKLFAILTLVCFMFTLMPVAAFAADGYAWVNDGDEYVKLGSNGTATVTLHTSDTADTVYVFAMADGALSDQMYFGSAGRTGIIKITNMIANGAELALNFTEQGEYTVYLVDAGEYENTLVVNASNGKSQTQIAKELIANSDNVAVMDNNVITVNPSSTDYRLSASVDGSNFYFEDTEDFAKIVEAGLATVSNGADEAPVWFKLENKDGNDWVATKTATLEISTNSSAVEVSKETVTTNPKGIAKVTLSSTIAGDFKLYVEYGNKADLTADVTANATSAAVIETKYNGSLVDLDTDLSSTDIMFTITDINGNLIKAKDNTEFDDRDDYYVKVVEAPAASAVTNKVLATNAALYYSANEAAWYLSGVELDAEGDYEFKVILANGASATATVSVKEFQTPVSISLNYQAPSVELNGYNHMKALKFVDANGVKTTKGTEAIKVAATGYAVETFGLDENGKTKVGTVKAKGDEGYIGSTITVTAVSTKYNLVATTSMVVANEAAEVKYASTEADVAVNNTLTANIVDVDGNKVALNKELADLEISYIVLEKPENAKVAVSTANAGNLATKGEFKVSFTANKIGAYKVQTIVTYEQEYGVVKYYSGIETITVGNTGFEDIVVMSIGSNEIVVNNEVKTIDAAPIVENNRTFVPFRALAEAFGAEVAYDEATQAVTAELNDTTVVMTIGSATYTVNGVEKTADVAPFINGSRTMVPVRFVAEAFGITVTPTYDDNGATADILFAK